jgi:hypothetical protein
VGTSGPSGELSRCQSLYRANELQAHQVGGLHLTTALGSGSAATLLFMSATGLKALSLNAS